MSSRTLFDLTSEFRVNPKITEPVIWVQRLAVVESWSLADKPVLDIEFRRGLNIIATAVPPKGERDRVGHDVGKTLLTRLLRYCLGEAHYGRKSVREALQREFPEGHVIAQFSVAGETWIVSRPLVQEQRPASWSWSAASWSDVLKSGKGTAYSHFANHLTEVTASRCAPVILPGRKRPIAWLDILAWLTRDQHCAYRDPLEWRTRWSDSGSGEMDLEDASLVVRLSMDLVNEAEGKLIEERKALLQSKSTAADSLASRRARLQRTRELLIERLGASEEFFEGPLFSQSARKVAEDRLGALNQSLDQLPVETGLENANQELRDAELNQGADENTLRLRKTDRKNAETELEQNAQADSTSGTGFEDMFGCPLKHRDCEHNKPQRADQARKELRQEQVNNLTRRIAVLDREIAEAGQAVKRGSKRITALKERTTELQKVTSTKAIPIRREMAKLDAVLEELVAYDSVAAKCDRAERRIAGLEQKLAALRLKQQQLAARNSGKLKRLNESLAYVSKFILGKNAEDVLRIGINRLTFATDDQQSSPGEGMATSATLSLDLACLRASLTGLGYLPRFLIHDSPRGGDLEHHLYARMFELIFELESVCPSPAPFQYILATTTQPPDHLRKKPFVRITLDARDPKLHLLGRQF